MPRSAGCRRCVGAHRASLTPACSYVFMCLCMCVFGVCVLCVCCVCLCVCVCGGGHHTQVPQLEQDLKAHMEAVLDAAKPSPLAVVISKLIGDEFSRPIKIADVNCGTSVSGKCVTVTQRPRPCPPYCHPTPRHATPHRARHATRAQSTQNLTCPRALQDDACAGPARAHLEEHRQEGAQALAEAGP